MTPQHKPYLAAALACYTPDAPASQEQACNTQNYVDQMPDGVDDANWEMVTSNNKTPLEPHQVYGSEYIVDAEQQYE